MNIFAITYIDNILVYGNLLSKYKKHVGLVLDRMQEAALQLDILKNEFHIQEVIFLGLLIGKNRICINPKKIEAIQEYKMPQSIKVVQLLVGFTNFYCRFIQDFSAVI